MLDADSNAATGTTLNAQIEPDGHGFHVLVYGVNDLIHAVDRDRIGRTLAGVMFRIGAVNAPRSDYYDY